MFVVITALFFKALFVLPLGCLEGIPFATPTLALVIRLAVFLREPHVANASAANQNQMNQ